MRLLTTCFLVLTLCATSSAAQNLPAWAEPSDQPSLQDRSPFQSRVDRQRSYDQFTRSRQVPHDETAAPFPGAAVDNNGGGNNGSSCEQGNGDGEGNTYNGGCENHCTDNPNDDICQDLCAGSPNDWTDNQRAFCIDTGIAVPIDDYLPLLALAGILLAYYRLRT